MEHRPVMVEAVMSGLVWNPHGTYLDATFGRGGHAQCLLNLIAKDAKLVVLDRDPEAICFARHLRASEPRVHVIQGCFGALSSAISSHGFGGFDGILFDCGVSSPQLDDARRGFSFQQTGQLDMRMDPETGVSAAEWLNNAPEREIADVIKEYGGERNANAIAKSIVQHRPLKCTNQLSQLIIEASTHFDSGKHPATRTFQAVRMKINDELAELDKGLSQAFELLNVGGRIATLTFHSLEHRLVRQKFRALTQSNVPRGLPLQGDLSGPGRLVVKKAVPSYLETAENPRSRSAMLQIIEKAR